MSTLPLKTGIVDLWTLSTDSLTLADEIRMRALLSDEELTVVDKCRRVGERRSRLLGRALLRTVLTRYTGISPTLLQFSRSEFGKPALADPELGVAFNLSHTDDKVVCAFSRECNLGVDIEHIRYRKELLNIMDGYMSIAEKCRITGEPWPKQQKVFFDHWVLKESFVKATGDGLTQPLDQVEFHKLSGSQFEFRPVIHGKRTRWRSWLWPIDELHRLSITIDRSMRRRVMFRGFYVLPCQLCNG